MSRLNDIIAGVIEGEMDSFGRVDVHHAASVARDQIGEDEREYLVTIGLNEMIKKAAQRGRKSAEAAAASTQSTLAFKELRAGYAVDIDGRVIKRTEDLIEIEWRRLISIRRESIEADQAHLKLLEDVYAAAAPFWQQHPEITFGEVCRLLVQARGAA